MNPREDWQELVAREHYLPAMGIAAFPIPATTKGEVKPPKERYLNAPEERMPRQAFQAVHALFVLTKAGIKATTIPHHLKGRFLP